VLGVWSLFGILSIGIWNLIDAWNLLSGISTALFHGNELV